MQLRNKVSAIECNMSAIECNLSAMWVQCECNVSTMWVWCECNLSAMSAVSLVSASNMSAMSALKWNLPTGKWVYLNHKGKRGRMLWNEKERSTPPPKYWLFACKSVAGHISYSVVGSIRQYTRGTSGRSALNDENALLPLSVKPFLHQHASDSSLKQWKIQFN